MEPCRREVIWISREFVARLTQVFPFPAAVDWEQPFLLRTAGTPWESLGGHIHASVEETLCRGPGWEAIVAGNTMVLLTLLARALSGQEGAPLAQAEKPELLERVFAYIEAHLGEQITLTDTAKHFFPGVQAGVWDRAQPVSRAAGWAWNKKRIGWLSFSLSRLAS